MENFYFANLNREIVSPLNQFEIRDLLSLDAPVLGNLHISITNIGLYLMIGAFFILALNLLSTNYNKLVGNNWSISMESLYATIHSIVTNQINPKGGQAYFPFLYALFIFILINNLIGMVKQCLGYILQKICNFIIFKILTFKPRPRAIPAAGGYAGIKNSYSTLSNNLASTAPGTQPCLLADERRAKYNFKNNNSYYLNPYYITGFTDGEGCFSLSLHQEKRMFTGWQIKPIFSIALHNRDINILEAIQRTFGVGKIYKHGADSIQYRVSSLKDIKIIIAHFDNYPLITKKCIDYLLFKQAFSLMEKKEHLTNEGLLKLISIKSVLNRGLSERFKESFPSLIPVEIPKSFAENNKIEDLNWFRGFVEAEGSFQVTARRSPKKYKINIGLKFSLTQHSRDKVLISKFVEYLNCGRICEASTRYEIYFLVSVYSDIVEKILPLFKEYPLIGVKKKDCLDFFKVAELMKTKKHLTDEGLKEILIIKNNMNKNSSDLRLKKIKNKI